MSDRNGSRKAFMTWGLACAALVVAHLAMHSGDPANPNTKKAAPPTISKSRLPNPEADAEAWAAWRDSRAPSAQDSRADRASKGLTETMRGFRQQPVEFVEDEGRKDSLRVVTSTADLKSILDAGGSYSGPLPPELIEPKDEAAPAGGSAVDPRPASASPAASDASKPNGPAEAKKQGGGS